MSITFFTRRPMSLAEAIKLSGWSLGTHSEGGTLTDGTNYIHMHMNVVGAVCEGAPLAVGTQRPSTEFNGFCKTHWTTSEKRDAHLYCP